MTTPVGGTILAGTGTTNVIDANFRVTYNDGSFPNVSSANKTASHSKAVRGDDNNNSTAR